MNCPNCNKEVSPEWAICPFCKYEPVKCSNPECESVWLPTNAMFCPTCGTRLQSDNPTKTTHLEQDTRKVTFAGEQGWYAVNLDFEIWIDGSFVCRVPYKKEVTIELKKEAITIEVRHARTMLDKAHIWDKYHDLLSCRYKIDPTFSGKLQLKNNRLTSHLSVIKI